MIIYFRTTSSTSFAAAAFLLMLLVLCYPCNKRSPTTTIQAFLLSPINNDARPRDSFFQASRRQQRRRLNNNNNILDDNDDDSDSRSIIPSSVPSSMIKGVTLKLAFDEQWGVADLSVDKSERFTCSESLDMVHRLRRDSDAVLVGRSTVEIDDCSLTVRRVAVVPPTKQQPVRVILDPNLQLQLDKYQIANDGLPTIIFFHHNEEDDDDAANNNNSQKDTTTTTVSIEQQKEKFPNVDFVGLPNVDVNSSSTTTSNKKNKNRILSPREIVNILQTKYNIQHIMVEGGPQTAISFLQDNVVDRAIIVQAPIKFKQPLLSTITIPHTLQDAGLDFVTEYTLGVDNIQCWSRPNIPWPETVDNTTNSSTPWP